MTTGLQRQADDAAARAGGRVVKLLGEGRSSTSPDPGTGLKATVELLPDLQDELGLEGHAGIHVGRVIERDRDLYGMTVNLASRVADVARPGQILATEAVVGAVDDSRFEPVGVFSLEGLSDPVRLFQPVI